jgi:hypothetical protein
MSDDAIKRDENGRFLKGNPPGPGRKPGQVSVITELKKMFEEDPEDFKKFIERYKDNPNNEKHITEMIDGKANQSIEMEVTLPKPMMDLTEDE